MYEARRRFIILYGLWAFAVSPRDNSFKKIAGGIQPPSATGRPNLGVEPTRITHSRQAGQTLRHGVFKNDYAKSGSRALQQLIHKCYANRPE